jgi:hypothetical protein
MRCVTCDAKRERQLRLSLAGRMPDCNVMRLTNSSRTFGSADPDGALDQARICEGKMKKTILAGVAALFLATGALSTPAHSETGAP